MLLGVTISYPFPYLSIQDFIRLLVIPWNFKLHRITTTHIFHSGFKYIFYRFTTPLSIELCCLLYLGVQFVDRMNPDNNFIKVVKLLFVDAVTEPPNFKQTIGCKLQILLIHNIPLVVQNTLRQFCFPLLFFPAFCRKQYIFLAKIRAKVHAFAGIAHT